MIQISHGQARRLVHEMLDRPIADSSWSALQAHLEGCAECRAYQGQRTRLERSLRRALNNGWSGVIGPPPGLGRVLSQRLQIRARRLEAARRVLTTGGLAVLVVLGLVFYQVSLRSEPALNAPPRGAIAEAPGPVATPTPEPRFRSGSEYQGAVAFEALVWGVPEIMLLTTGPNRLEIENLTNNPASDSAPSWSPDGEWLAFLSNRDRPDGGADIYVMNVAGTRLTRLTADPRLDWTAPLAWSPDGDWIAARAVNQPAEAEQGVSAMSWIYRVGLRGGAPRPLPYTRGAHSPRFAPTEPRLAYMAVDGQLSFLRVYDALAGVTIDLTRSEAAAAGAGAGARDGAGSASVRAFDWAADGSGIVYILNRSEPERDPYWVQVRWAPLPEQAPVTDEALVNAQTSNEELLTFSALSPVVTAGLSGENELLYTRTYRRDGRWTTCRPLQTPSEPVFSTPGGQANGPDLPVLCIDSAIEREAWSSDGRTLVAVAHTTTEDDPGIYALNLPAVGESRRMVRSERLADLPEGAGPLRVRPERARGAPAQGLIDPSHPVDPAEGPAAPQGAPQGAPHGVGPILPPPNLLADVLLTAPQNAGFTVARVSKDGSGSELLPGARYGTCAVGSPDGRRVAFPAWEQGLEFASQQIFRADADGANAAPLTADLTFEDPAAPRLQRPQPAMYGCPVWSPDGRQLAVWAEAGGKSYLVVLAANGFGKPLVLPLTPSGYRTPPVWTADGQALTVFLQSADRFGAEIARVDVGNGITHQDSAVHDPTFGDGTFRDAAIRDGSIRNGSAIPDIAMTGGTANSGVIQDDSPQPGTVTYSNGTSSPDPVKYLLSTDGWSVGQSAASGTFDDWVAYTALRLTNDYQVQVGLRINSAADGRGKAWVSLPSYTMLFPVEGYGSLAWLQSAGPWAEPSLGVVFRGTPDGRVPSALMVYDPSTGRVSTLAVVNEFVQGAAWSPDGRWVIYSTNSGLWSLQVSSPSEPAAAPVWLADTRAVHLDW